MFNKNNGYKKHLTKEDNLHIAVYNYICLKYPKVLCIHVANEAKRSKFERWKAKAMGLTPGVPDLMIYFQRERIINNTKVVLSGLAIELKVIYNNGTRNTASKNQEKILTELHKNGWDCHVIWTYEDAIKVIDEYLSLK